MMLSNFLLTAILLCSPQASELTSCGANVFDAIYYSFIWAYIGANDKLRSPGERVSTHLGKG